MNLRKFLPKKEKEGGKPQKSFLVLEVGSGLVKGAFIDDQAGLEVKLESLREESQDGELNWEAVAKVSERMIRERGWAEKGAKIIFAVPSGFLEVAEAKIKEEYLLKLSKLSSRLGFEVSGFVTIEEALVHFYKKSEGVPLTAVLIGVYQETFSVGLCRVGKVTGVKSEKTGAGETALLVERIKEEIASLADSEILPARMILYGEKVSELKMALMGVDWTKEFNFLHFPKIEILEEDFTVKAAAAAVSSKMEVAEVSWPRVAEKESKEPEVNGEIEWVKPEEVDFRVSKKPGVLPEGVSSLAEKEDEGKKSEEVSRREAISLEEEEGRLSEDETREGGWPMVKRMKKGVSYLLPKGPLPRPSLPAGVGRLAVLGFLGMGALTVLGGVFFYFFPKAEIKLVVQPKVLEREVEVLALVGGELSLVKKQIPAEIISVKESGTKQGVTTGKKVVGEKATGEVKIFNKTLSEKIFEAGTVLSTASALDFVLKEKVVVVAASDTGTSLEYGSVGGAAEAADIGADYNIAEGTEMVIDDFPKSSFVARAQGDFEGGSSREVLVVEPEDQDRLSSNLKEELEKRGRENLRRQLAEGKSLAGEVLGVKTVRKDFDKKVGEEAESLTLAMETEFEGLVFELSDVTELMKSLVADSVPQGYTFRPENVEMRVTEVSGKRDEELGKEVGLLVDFKAELLPKLDLNELTKKMKGKRVEAVEEFLEGENNVSSYEITLKPQWLGFLRVMPLREENIVIKVVSQG